MLKEIKAKLKTGTNCNNAYSDTQMDKIKLLKEQAMVKYAIAKDEERKKARLDAFKVKEIH